MGNPNPKYQIIYSTKSDKHAFIKIQEGKFKHFRYYYDVISVDTASDPPKLNYNYVLTEAPKEYIIENEEDEKKEFEKLIGDILVDIITNKEGNIGKRNTEQPDTE